MTSRIGLAVAFSLAAAAASAEPPSPAPDQDASSREAADIIAFANAGTAFDNVTDGLDPAIRHKASGLNCRFGMDDREHGVSLLHDARRHTDTAACVSRTQQGWNVSVSATGFPFNPTLDEGYRSAARAFRGRFAGAKPAAGGFAETAADLPTRVIRLTLEQDGQPAFARREVAVAGRWVLIVDVDARGADPHAVDLGAAEIAAAAFKDSTRIADRAPETKRPAAKGSQPKKP